MSEERSEADARKEAVRREALAARAAMSRVARDEAALGIAECGADRFSEARTVAIYVSFASEPGTLPLIARLAAAGVSLIAPVVDGESLDWVELHVDAQTGVAELTSGRLGIPAPVGTRLGAAALRGADAILVPALAVDRRGTRLGRGRGFYDRALATVPPTLVTAIGYDAELVDHLPAAPHDRPVGRMLRPSGLTELSR